MAISITERSPHEDVVAWLKDNQLDEVVTEFEGKNVRFFCIFTSGYDCLLSCVV